MHYQLLTPTQNNPFVVAQYPMYFGAYCPHAFWHHTTPATTNRPGQEYVYTSSWNTATNKWNHEKVKSPAFCIIALLLLNINQADTQCGLPIVVSLQRLSSKDKNKRKEEIPAFLYSAISFVEAYHQFLSKIQIANLMEYVLSLVHSSTSEYQHLNSILHYQRPPVSQPMPTFTNED